MDEVPTVTTRAREAVVAVARRVGRLWYSFTDLGLGAVILSLGVLIVLGIGLAVFVGRDVHEPAPCDLASRHVSRIEHLGHSGHLTTGQVARLHDDADQLTAIAASAHGDDVKAITDAARVAGSTKAGQKLDTAKLAIEFEAACPPSRASGGGGGRF